jgi:hypothetical protein
MSIVTTFVGLDYHQDSVQVCILDQEGKIPCNRSVENHADVVVQVASRYGKPRRLAIEACSGAADLAETLATKHALPIDLAHPGYVARMKRSPDKTDYNDAHLLADLTRINYLPKVWLAPEPIRQLRRTDQRRIARIAAGAGRIGPSAPAYQRHTLVEVRGQHAAARQTEERRHRGGGQPVGPLAASRTAARKQRGDGLGSGSTKGVRPYRFARRLGLTAG